MKLGQLSLSKNLTVFCACVMIGSSAETTPAVDRILVVDDLPDNYFLLQTVLESEGYEVEVADNGRVALESIASHPPDLVLLDVMMPEMNGFEVTRRLRQNLNVI